MFTIPDPWPGDGKDKNPWPHQYNFLFVGYLMKKSTSGREINQN